MVGGDSMVIKVKTLVQQMVDEVKADKNLQAIYIGDTTCGDLTVVENGMMNTAVQDYEESVGEKATRIGMLSVEALEILANKVLSPEAVDYEAVLNAKSTH